MSNDNTQPNGVPLAAQQPDKLPPVMQHAIYQHAIALNDLTIAAAALIGKIIDEVGEHGLNEEEKLLRDVLKHPCLKKQKQFVAVIVGLLHYVTPGPFLITKEIGVGTGPDSKGVTHVIVDLAVSTGRRLACFMNQKQAEQIEKAMTAACDQAFGRIHKL